MRALIKTYALASDLGQVRQNKGCHCEVNRAIHTPGLLRRTNPPNYRPLCGVELAFLLVQSGQSRHTRRRHMASSESLLGGQVRQMRELVSAVWPLFDLDGTGRVSQEEFLRPGDGLADAIIASRVM